MENSKSRSKVVPIITLMAILLLGFYIYSRNSGGSKPAPTNQFTVGKDYILMLDQVSDIRLDKSIFSDRVFVSLRDGTRVVVSQPSGRVNPFANVPGFPAIGGATKR